jgi:hypothetical protein
MSLLALRLVLLSGILMRGILLRGIWLYKGHNSVYTSVSCISYSWFLIFRASLGGMYTLNVDTELCIQPKILQSVWVELIICIICMFSLTPRYKITAYLHPSCSLAYSVWKQHRLYEISSSHGGEYDVQNCLLGWVIIPDDGGSTRLWNVGRQSFYKAVHPRRQFWTT